MAIGANRSIIVARYAMEDEGLKVAVLTEHIENDGFRVPTNIVIVGTRGEAARTLVTKHGARKLTIN
jgi:hypothetical protein